MEKERVTKAAVGGGDGGVYPGRGHDKEAVRKRKRWEEADRSVRNKERRG